MGMTIPQSKPLLINLNVNNKTYDLPTTASAVGIDLNTGKQLYYNTSSLGWATQEIITASYGVFSQNLTASNLYLTGNPGRVTNEIGPLIISSSIGITTSGSIIFSGSRSSLGTEQSSVLVNGDIFVSGGLGTNDYLQLKPVNLLRIPTNTTASYIYTSGSTNDMYFTQYNGPYTNTTRLRWLEGNLSTGLLNGGTLSTTNGTTTFNVNSGSGIILSFNASTSTDPYPTIKTVTWPLSSSIPLYYSGSAQITYVGIDSNGKVVQNITPFAQTDYQNYIVLGRILHQTNAVTNGTISSPFVAYGQSTWNADFNRAFGPLKISGHTLAPSGSGITLSLTKSAGDTYVEGRNYITDPNSPNLVLGSVEGAQLTSKIFREYNNLNGTPTILNNGGAGYPEIEPGIYNPGNLGVTGSVGPGKFTIQRVFWFPNSVNKAFFVYYGTTEYGTISEALSSIPTDFFVEGNNTANAAILLAYLIVAYNATDLNNAAQAKIVQAGIFRGLGVGGGGGGGSVNPGGVDTSIQYNNASAFGGSTNLTFNSTTNTLSTVNLQVSGIVGASGSVTLGDASSDIVTVTGQLTASQGISASNNISTAGNLLVQGNSQFTGSAYFAGNVTLGDASSDATTTTSQLTASNGIAVTGGTLSSSGNISTAGNLYVQGTSFHTGAAYFGNVVSASSGFQAGASSTFKAMVVSGAINAAQTISASGNISTAGSLFVQGNTQITGAVNVASTMSAAGNLSVGGTITTTGLTLGGTVGAQALSITGNANIGNDPLDITTIGGQLTASYGMRSNGVISSSGNISTAGNLYVQGTTQLTGAVNVASTLSSAGNLSTAGNLYVQGTSFFTGSSYFAGSMTFGDASADVLTVTGRLTASQGLSASGNVSVLGNMLVQGNEFLTGNLYVTGSSTFAGPVVFGSTATDVLQFTGSMATQDLTVAGTASFAGPVILGSTSETFVITQSLPATTSSFNYLTATVFYVSGTTNNGIWNVTNVPTTSGRASSITFVIEQGGTPVSASSYQINGAAVTVKWPYGVIPIGQAGKTDIIGLTAFRTGSTWNVVGSLNTFG